jgi:hypothetical protein
MIKASFIFSFICLSFLSFGQKTKTVEIWKKPFTKEILNANYAYNENDELAEVTIHMLGQDARYQQLISYITLFYGSPIEFYDFWTELEKFYNENDAGTKTEIYGQTVSLIQVMGSTGLLIFEKDGSGYRSINLKTIEKFKERFEEWAIENDIEYQD